MTTTVRTQAELDAALKAKTRRVVIDAPKALKLVVGATGDSEVEIGGETTIQRVGDSATIQRVGDSATIQRVGGSATIQSVGDSATIQSVGGSATIQSVGGSATIQSVGDSATIQRVGGSATIQRVGDSATIQSVGGSATIQSVGGSATIQRVGGSATAHLRDGAKALKCGPHTTVYVHSADVTFDDGGHVVDLTELDMTDPVTWCEFNGVDVTDGKAVLFKAVDHDLVAGHSYIPTTYTIGATVTAPDWRKDDRCGGGLHLCAEPAATLRYFDADPVRFLACEVAVADLVVLDDKVKVQSLKVLHEVTIGGDPVAVSA